ncbi:peptidoglycan-recognition protein LF-like [Condylostylus longicornis]|uniref:peptidoglycan-recognition protein LF-like n=1 Tax=Condylostylus longicornis TaxID=2530218 RepID=UPI00244E0007|nr:peptidoglycan-recognition protein LF-like [Condylostylus longicornis]
MLIYKIFLLTILHAVYSENINCVNLNDFYNYNQSVTIDGDPIPTISYVSRTDWIAQPPNDELVDLILPVHRIIIAHTATEPCTTLAQCVFRTRDIQTFHIEARGFDDIAYNFLIGGDGLIYIGRGWNKIGVTTKGFNNDSLSIGLIGSFSSVAPPEIQINAVKFLIREGLKTGKISYDFKLYGQNQLINTTSPGEKLIKIIKTWPNFVTDVNSGSQNVTFCKTQSQQDSSFKLITRKNWLAQPPSSLLSDLVHPTKYVIISQTATDTCDTQSECIFRVRLIQALHMESRWYDDISYNFLIGGDGSVYEGRGWDKVGVHTRGYNQISIGIAFIGNFNEIEPNKNQLEAAKLLIDEGVRKGKLSSDYILKGQKQFAATESPGLALLNIIKTWQHYCDDDNCDYSSNKTPKYISRLMWNAQEPTDLLDNLTLPVHKVIIAHTATKSCDEQTKCIQLVKSIQNYHINSKNFHDIAYNFLIDSNGFVYEGRGWNIAGAHTRGFNEESIGIALIGTFTKNTPTANQLNATKLLINEGVKLGKLSSNYVLYGHRQLVPTESPGNNLFNEISTWPNFVTNFNPKGEKIT